MLNYDEQMVRREGIAQFLGRLEAMEWPGAVNP